MENNNQTKTKTIEPSYIVSSIIIVICIALFGIEYLVNETLNIGYLVIWFCIDTGIFFTKYYKERKKHELAVAIGYSIFALISVVLYFLMLFHVI